MRSGHAGGSGGVETVPAFLPRTPDMQHAAFVVELDERIAACVERAGLRLLQALDLAQLAQQRQQRAQGIGTGSGHRAVPQASQRLRRL